MSLIRQATKAREIRSCLKGMGLELGVLCSNSRCVTRLAISPCHLPGKGGGGAHLRRFWNESDDVKGEGGRNGKEEVREKRGMGKEKRGS